VTAVLLRTRTDLRAHLRAWIALALLIGIVGGAVVAVAAGARRTSTAYPRLVQEQKPLDVDAPADAPVERLPQVLEVAHFYQLTPIVSGRTDTGRPFGRPYIYFRVAVDQRAVDYVNRSKLLEGRRFDPTQLDEAVVGFDTARTYGLHPGSTILVRLARAADFPQGYDGGPFFPTEGGVQFRVRVVGVDARAGEFPPNALGQADQLMLTPAFAHSLGPELLHYDTKGIRVKPGTLPALLAGARAVYPNLDPTSIDTVDQHHATTKRAMHLGVLALWLLTGLVGLAALLIVGQALARQAYLESGEVPSLRALGMTPRQIWEIGMLRAAFVGVAGALVAVAVAVACSPLFPIGLARVAEPHPGLAADWVALGAGAAAVVVLVVGLAALPAWRVARVTVARRRQERPSVADALARNGFPPTAVSGVRLALETGRGRVAVPIRSTLAGAALGVAALAAAFTFGAGLQHLLDTPRLYGWTWDVQFGDGYGPDQYDVAASTLASVRTSISGMSGGTVAGLEIKGRPVLTTAVQPMQGVVEPVVVEGREPFAPDEIFLGSKELRALGVGVGDTISARVTSVSYKKVTPTPPRRLRIVGRGVTPESEQDPPGRGAFMTYESLTQMLGSPPNRNLFLVAFAPGVTLAEGQQKLGRIAANGIPHQRPVDLVNFGRVENLPLLIAGLMALVGASMLAHTLVTSVRRRRRDLAILKTLGFERRQVSLAVAWQATTTVAIALLVGLPLGVAAGRWSWTAFADNLGVLPDPVVPLLSILVAVPATLVVANLVAAGPAFAAGRMRPATVLRAE
jgi:putative ABC transport system permease protein